MWKTQYTRENTTPDNIFKVYDVKVKLIQMVLLNLWCQN